MSAADRYWPVVLEFTEHRVVLVEAETAAEAATVAADYGPDELWEDAERLDVLDGVGVSSDAAVWYGVGRHDRPIGPREACPDCGAVATSTDRIALASARHSETCASFMHHVSRTAAFAPQPPDGGPWERVGWFLVCGCGEPGFETTANAKTVEHFPGRAVYTDDAELAEAARAHVDGRPHFMNVTVGVDETVYHPDPRRRSLAPAGVA